ncbi:MAG: hypothetical protein ABIQ90_12025 [Polaromonas sp.]
MKAITGAILIVAILSARLKTRKSGALNNDGNCLFDETDHRLTEL